jgi:serine/threonine protein kinase
MDRWNQIEELFHAALAQPRDRRAEFLRQACHSDSQLRDEVLSLLDRANDDAFLETSPLPLSKRATTVSVGQTLGNFELLEFVGRGGMGEVYRAKDKRLNREVAIKVAGASFSDRFEREAQAVAALNHPNICTLHDVGPNYLVMELVEGPTLAEKIKGGPVALDETLAIAHQIAEALEAAHEQGIVHRDLKPANIKIKADGTVKVLDFGLATMAPQMVTSANPESASTLTTYVGLVAGTPAYMSPEQASGKPVDKRADIWAFGVVLWEMLTGRRLFKGTTVTETLAEVLRAEIDFSALPRETPETTCELLSRCLDRNAKTRLRDIGEARVSIERCQTNSKIELASQPVPPRGRFPAWMWMVAGIAILLATLGSLTLFRRSDRSLGTQNWRQITDFPDSATSPNLSRDGRMLAFTRGGGWFMKTNEIYLKVLPDGPAVQLTHNGGIKTFPVFSPDSARIAYTVAGFHTWYVPVFGGGAPQPLLERATGLGWIGSNRILFSENSAKGMALETALENGAEEREIYLPEPEGMAHFSSLSTERKQVLVVEMPGRGPFGPCRVVPFDGSSKGHQVGPNPAYCSAAAWSPDGKWMYFTVDTGDGSHIWRQRVGRNKPQQLTSGPTEEQGLAIAPDGKSLFTSVGSKHASVWVHDAAGDRQVSGEGSLAYTSRITLSPDGARVYYRTHTQLWATDVKSGQREEVFPGTSITTYSLSPDGSSVVYGKSDQSTWIGTIDRRSPPLRLPLENPGRVQPGRSGRLYFTVLDRGKNYLYSMYPEGRDRRKALAHLFGTETRHDFYTAEVSPDERWAISGVDPNPNGLGVYKAWPLSGGREIDICGICGLVTWSTDGKSILFTFRAMLGEASTTVAVPLKNGAMFPPLPKGGVQNMADVVKLPGAIVIPYELADVGPAGSLYAYSRSTLQQNIFQIPLPQN